MKWSSVLAGGLIFVGGWSCGRRFAWVHHEHMDPDPLPVHVAGTPVSWPAALPATPARPSVQEQAAAAQAVVDAPNDASRPRESSAAQQLGVEAQEQAPAPASSEPAKTPAAPFVDPAGQAPTLPNFKNPDPQWPGAPPANWGQTVVPGQ